MESIRFVLKRVSSTSAGTFGVLLDHKVPFATTVEPPWRDNQVDISCIPAGIYRCKRFKSRKWGSTFLIQNVPNRTWCIFHTGNFGFSLRKAKIKSATKGCVVIGEEFGELNRYPALLSSKKGFKEFKSRTEGIDHFYIQIEDCSS